MAQTMKAAVLRKIGGPLQLEELPVPDPKAGEILIMVFAIATAKLSTRLDHTERHLSNHSALHVARKATRLVRR
jgi:Zn-dependent alcohol dehydrogenase